VAGAIGDALSNTIRALPLLLVWSLLWLVLNVLTFVLRGDDSDDEPVQAGDSLWDLSLRGLCDATRMLVFLALPALAWEAHAGPLYAIRRAATVAKTYKLEFAAGFVLSELAALLAVWPPTVVLLYDAESDLGAPGLAWVVAVALAGLGWSFVMLVQQLFAAELYAWFLVWEDACERARAEGTVAPAPTDIRRPMVVDGVPDLVAVGT
jgi:hypothetical protein